MKRIIILLLLVICVEKSALAWGREGHEIVAQLAYELLSEKAKANVTKYLSDITIPKAGTWMDDVRSDKSYDFMKPWHYINIDKGKGYIPSTDQDVVNEILIAIRELEHKDKLCDQQIKFDLLVLFHLIGDIHQPLHTGYGDDKGGNDIQLRFLGNKTNLHSLWDSKMIEDQHINLATVEKGYKELAADIIDHEKATTVEDWVKTSRMYLPLIYNFSDPSLDENYAKQNKEIIVSQLMNAGIHLAATLEKVFGDNTAEPSKPVTKDSTTSATEITPVDAVNYIGKEITVCGKVYGVKESAKVIFLNMGAAYPNSPFTVVIFAADKENMKIKLSKYDKKNICVTGIVQDYNGKAEIIVKSESQIAIR